MIAFSFNFTIHSHSYILVSVKNGPDFHELKVTTKKEEVHHEFKHN